MLYEVPLNQAHKAGKFGIALARMVNQQFLCSRAFTCGRYDESSPLTTPVFS